MQPPAQAGGQYAGWVPYVPDAMGRNVQHELETLFSLQATPMELIEPVYQAGYQDRRLLTGT